MYVDRKNMTILNYSRRRDVYEGPRPKKWDRDKVLYPLDLKKHPKGIITSLANSRSGHFFVINNIYSWLKDNKRGDRLFINLENKMPDQVLCKFINLQEGVFDMSVKIIQVRDLLNWSASLLKKQLDLQYGKEDMPWSATNRMESWYAIAKEVFRETNVLNNTFVRVHYDEFFISEEYRRSICDQLGGDYNESQINRVALPGGGSSFTGHDFDNKASEMKVLTRYKAIPVEHFSFLKQYPEIIQFYIKHFNPDGDKLRFIDQIMN